MSLLWDTVVSFTTGITELLTMEITETSLYGDTAIKESGKWRNDWHIELPWPRHSSTTWLPSILSPFLTLRKAFGSVISVFSPCSPW
jgi:hypothetical protein